MDVPGPFVHLALAYAARGWRVLPLRPRRKDPATDHGSRDATTSAPRIRGWWRWRPDANVGIATGHDGLFVVDVDGPAGEAALAALEAELGALPPTYEVKTGRDEGGRQLYFRALGYVRGTQDELGLSIDVRGAGNYVVAAGSIHPSGRTYEVIADLPVAHAPGWLVERVCGDEPAAEAAIPPSRPARPGELDALQRACLNTGPDRVRRAPKGRRNHTLNREAHGLARARVPRELAEAPLKNAALAAGLTPRAVRATFESGWTAGMRASPIARRSPR